MPTSDPTTLYKLIILFMLDNADYPLSNTSISDFILTMEYTNFFTLQQTLEELIDSNLITSEINSDKVAIYRITDNGHITLDYFNDKISDTIKDEIIEYCNKHEISLKKDIEVEADYYNIKGNQYAIRCQIKDKSVVIFELLLNTVGAKQAETMCNNFKSKSDDVYNYLMDMLVQ
ncbi:MAG: DUF4364 family protein [Lachnospiraceae bacterium]|nr:DUF4364 family protein [Lachnospiraceae bacterium]